MYDSVIVKGPKQPKGRDPIIQQIVKNGLVLTNHLRLYDYTSFWDPLSAPDFLKYNGKLEPFMWLSRANITTYYRFGENDFLLKKVMEYYDPLKPKIYVPLRRKTHNYNSDIEARAYLGSFFRNLSAMLDSLAIEIILVSGIFDVSLCHATFPGTIARIKDYNIENLELVCRPLFDRFKNQILGFISGSEPEKDWFEQFLEYRRAFTHRKNGGSLTHITTTKIEPPKLKQRNYLLKDLWRAYEDIGDEPVEQETWEEIQKRYLGQTLDEYCPALFQKTKQLLELAYSCIYKIYRLREAKILEYTANYTKILPQKPANEFKMFIDRQ
jgi:hypothetical protein